MIKNFLLVQLGCETGVITEVEVVNQTSAQNNKIALTHRVDKINSHIHTNVTHKYNGTYSVLN